MERVLRVLIGCFVLMVLIMTNGAAAETYEVGDTTGWRVPTSNSFYSDWAKTKTFRVGDQLSFNWTGTHDVAQVTEEQYESCTKVSNVTSVSPALINLTTSGSHYYICTIGNHCQSGQKLEIEVSTSNSTTPGSTPPSSTPGSTNSTPGSTPPSSSPSSLPIGALSATILSILVFSFFD